MEENKDQNQRDKGGQRKRKGKYEKRKRVRTTERKPPPSQVRPKISRSSGNCTTTLAMELQILFYSPMFLLFSYPVMSDSSWPHWLQHSRLPCPSPSPGVCPSSCPLHQWCHPAIYLILCAPFSCCLQSYTASVSFPMSQLFASASTSVLPMSIQGWFPLRLAGLISSQSKGLSKVFSSTTVRKHEYSYFSLFPKLLHWLYATF